MADSQEKHPQSIRKGGKYCVAGLSNGVSCKNRAYQNPNISLHKFPKDVITRNASKDKICEKASAHIGQDLLLRVLCFVFSSLSSLQTKALYTPGVTPGTKVFGRLKAGAVPTKDSTVCFETYLRGTKTDYSRSIIQA
ncbi:uncharacterized protein LOC144640918 [Oculina patagonica]